MRRVVAQDNEAAHALSMSVARAVDTARMGSIKPAFSNVGKGREYGTLTG